VFGKGRRRDLPVDYQRYISHTFLFLVIFPMHIHIHIPYLTLALAIEIHNVTPREREYNGTGPSSPAATWTDGRTGDDY
jgi:hypothetical protein